ncbi:NUDIX hydrolase [uncultured Ilyobacter sp.]|uniref:NUDIX hydrolase n=1 Tax=uncultured Ilyobacter sp. TaxID=544433 RepID=UPI0029C739D1|nr:NUDIX hydrolase [uncultured Ilyobacter sp.]
MRYRIRVAAIVIQNNQILLVKSLNSKSSNEWWAPPGGGLEDVDSDIHACAVRETCEETGYTIETGDILYISEFLDPQYDSHNLEIFLKGEIVFGEIGVKDPLCRQCDGLVIEEARWFSKDELCDLTVFPESIKTSEFWGNYDQKIYTKYLGRTRG